MNALSATARATATPCLVRAHDELYRQSDFTPTDIYLPPDAPPAEPIFSPAFKRLMAWGLGASLALGALANYFV